MLFAQSLHRIWDVWCTSSVVNTLSLHSCGDAVCAEERSGEQQSSCVGSADRERKGTASTGGHSAAEERKAGALLSPADAQENTERSGSRWKRSGERLTRTHFFFELCVEILQKRHLGVFQRPHTFLLISCRILLLQRQVHQVTLSIPGKGEQLFTFSQLCDSSPKNENSVLICSP